MILYSFDVMTNDAKLQDNIQKLKLCVMIQCCMWICCFMMMRLHSKSMISVGLTLSCGNTIWCPDKASNFNLITYTIYLFAVNFLGQLCVFLRVIYRAAFVCLLWLLFSGWLDVCFNSLCFFFNSGKHMDVSYDPCNLLIDNVNVLWWRVSHPFLRVTQWGESLLNI